jgi:hypothetical protein
MNKYEILSNFTYILKLMFPLFLRAILKKWANIKHDQQIKWCIGLNTIWLSSPKLQLTIIFLIPPF